MFVVTSTSPLDESWEERDMLIRSKVGKKSTSSGASSTAGRGVRNHFWEVATFDEAMTIREVLDSIPDVTATIREKISHAS